MRNISLVLISLFCISIAAYGQRGAIEVGAGAGISVNSAPTENMAIRGAKTPVNYSILFNAFYNVHQNIAVGAELRLLELSRSGSDVVILIAPPAPVNNRKAVYSDMMMTLCAVGNAKLNVKRGYWYGGLAGGYATNLHDSAKIKLTTEYYRAPNDGSGFVWGGQLGFVYGVTRIMGLNLEVAMRKYYLSYDSYALGTNDALEYNITAYTVTAGVKFRILPPRKIQNDIPGMRGKGQSL